MEDVIQQIFRFISAILSIYMMVIFVRIIMTWFRGFHNGRAQELLSRMTDPYLNWFRRNVPVRFGALDFSPVVGILVLGLLNTISNQLAFAGSITFSFVLAIIVSAVWSVVSFFLTFFLILAGIRLIGLLMNVDTSGRLWLVLEQIVNPALQIAVRPFLRGRFTSYRHSLLIFVGELAVVLIAGRLLTTLLIGVVQQIPI
ncbi:MAG: YggT family protein [Alkalispirochaeta sp.]